MDCGTWDRLNVNWFKIVEGLNIACNSEKTEALAQTDSKITKVWKMTLIKTGLEKKPSIIIKERTQMPRVHLAPFGKRLRRRCGKVHVAQKSRPNHAISRFNFDYLRLVWHAEGTAVTTNTTKAYWEHQNKSGSHAGFQWCLVGGQQLWGKLEDGTAVTNKQGEDSTAFWSCIKAWRL